MGEVSGKSSEVGLCRTDIGLVGMQGGLFEAFRSAEHLLMGIKVQFFHDVDDLGIDFSLTHP